MHRVHTLRQARAGAEAGMDVVVAQGSGAGGNCGAVAVSVLVPQVERPGWEEVGLTQLYEADPLGLADSEQRLV
jgi:hypothetical protein